MNKDIIFKLFKTYNKKIFDNKTSKEDRKAYIAINRKLLELLEQ